MCLVAMCGGVNASCFECMLVCRRETYSRPLIPSITKGKNVTRPFPTPFDSVLCVHQSNALSCCVHLCKVLPHILEFHQALLICKTLISFRVFEIYPGLESCCVELACAGCSFRNSSWIRPHLHHALGTRRRAVHASYFCSFSIHD